jgi:hypothetical protein
VAANEALDGLDKDPPRLHGVGILSSTNRDVVGDDQIHAITVPKVRLATLIYAGHWRNGHMKRRVSQEKVSAPRLLRVRRAVREVLHLDVWVPQLKFGSNEVLSDGTFLPAFSRPVENLAHDLPSGFGRVVTEGQALTVVPFPDPLN